MTLRKALFQVERYYFAGMPFGLAVAQVLANASILTADAQESASRDGRLASPTRSTRDAENPGQLRTAVINMRSSKPAPSERNPAEKPQRGHGRTMNRPAADFKGTGLYLRPARFGKQ